MIYLIIEEKVIVLVIINVYKKKTIKELCCYMIQYKNPLKHIRFKTSKTNIKVIIKTNQSLMYLQFNFKNYVLNPPKILLVLLNYKEIL